MRLHEAIRRSIAYRYAGADCVYPMGLTEAAPIATFVDALRCPVNVMIRKGLPGRRAGTARREEGQLRSLCLLRRAGIAEASEPGGPYPGHLRYLAQTARSRSMTSIG